MIRFNRVFECGLNFHHDDLLLIIMKHQNRLIFHRQLSKEYIENHDDTNSIKLDEFFRNNLSILFIGLSLSILIFITELHLK